MKKVRHAPHLDIPLSTYMVKGYLNSSITWMVIAEPKKMSIIKIPKQ